MKPNCSIILLALTCLATAGCTNPPLKSRLPTSPESAEALFLRSFDELAESNSSPARETLHKSFPESVWTQKADALAELYNSHRQSLQRAGELKNGLRTCENEGRNSRKQIEQLKNDLNRMKELVIEMELRSK